MYIWPKARYVRTDDQVSRMYCQAVGKYIRSTEDLG